MRKRFLILIFAKELLGVLNEKEKLIVHRNDNIAHLHERIHMCNNQSHLLV